MKNCDPFYCDHDYKCTDSCRLPPAVAKMLMEDRTLMLLIIGHDSERAGKVVKRGKGWKVVRSL